MPKEMLPSKSAVQLSALALMCLVVTTVALQGLVVADQVGLKDGRVLSGKFARLPGVAVNPLTAGDSSGVLKVLVCDNELYRTMVSTSQIQPESVSVDEPATERIRIPQRVAVAQSRVGSIGQIYQVQPFDEFGRRTVSVNSGRGRIDIIQGITEITPTWTKIEALNTDLPQRRFTWDMRVATNSIPREQLSRVLQHHLDKNNSDHRLRIVRLYIQSDRYQDAEAELEQLIKDFPNLAELESEVLALRRLNANRVLKELELRRTSGQHRMVFNLLQNFPSENVSDETLVQVRGQIEEYLTTWKQAAQLVASIQQNLAAIEDTDLQAKLKPICDEMANELYFTNLDRLATYDRMSSDPNLDPAQKLALAISGWILGANSAVESHQLALSLLNVRNLIHDYLNQSDKSLREDLLTRIQAEEAYRPDIIADIIARMKPPLATELNATHKYQFQVPGLQPDSEVTYHIQLPPEYDPFRTYPAIVTLHSGYTNAEQQLDWWAGAMNDQGLRSGQAARHGYIVIAPEWASAGQNRAQHSPAEHVAVLNSLRDACRRFSIDTDKVFLTGHAMGGDAAWEIGVSHPDLWAGVIPIAAQSGEGNVIRQYARNAKQLPIYLLLGELDGSKLINSAMDLDRYFKAGYDITVVEYLGRGHEDLYDDIHNLFDWMGRKKRNFFPTEIATSSSRPWDNFFWWIELADLPSEAVTTTGSPPSGMRALTVDGSVNPTGGINVRARAGKVTVWLSPKFVDVSNPLNVMVNGKRVLNARSTLELDVQVLLEDVRTRGDRQNPFWAKIE